MVLMVLLVLMVLRVCIEGGVAVDRLERLLVRAQHLTSGPIDTTLEEIVMDTADIRNNKQNNNLLKGSLIIWTENHAISPPAHRCVRICKCFRRVLTSAVYLGVVRIRILQFCTNIFEIFMSEPKGWCH